MDTRSKPNEEILAALERLEGLQALTAALSRAATPEQVYRVALEQAIRVLGMRAGGVTVVCPDGSLEIIEAQGQPPGVIEAQRRLAADADHPLAETVRLGKALYFRSAEERNAKYPHLVPLFSPLTRSSAFVPLLSRSGVLGVLTLSFPEPHPFGEAEQAFITSLTEVCAAALERARLFEAAREAKERRAETSAMLEAVLGNSPVGTAIFDSRSRYLRINAALAALNGKPAWEHLGRTFAEVYPEAERLGEYLRRALQGESITGMEVSGPSWRDPREIKHFLASWYPVELGGEARYATAQVVDITGRVRAEEAARDAEARLNLALESARMGWWEWDVVSGQHRWSPGFERLLGLEPGQFAGGVEAFLERVHPQDRERVGAVIEGGSGAARPREFEYRVPDGDTVRWVASRAQVFYGAGGKPERIIGVDADITERHQAEANAAFLSEVGEALARLSTLEEIMAAVGAKIGAYLNVPYCHFMRIDEAANEVIYLARWNAEGAARLPDKVRLSEHISEEFRALAHAGKTVASNNTGVNPVTNGEANAAIHAIAFVTVPFLQGEEWKYQFSVHDTRPREWREDQIELVRELANRVSPWLERARAEARLRESEARLRLALNAAQLGTWTWDLATGKADLDPRAAQIVGLEADTLLDAAQAQQARIHPEDLGRMQAELEAGIAGGGTFRMAYRTLHPDGGIRHVVSDAYVVAGDQGGPALLVGTNRDVTPEAQAQARLRASEERFRRTVEEAPVPIIMQAEDGEVLQVSRAWTELTGYALSDIPTFEAWLNRAYSSGADQVREKINSLFRGEVGMAEVEFDIVTWGGDLRTWALSASVPGSLSDGRRFVVGMAVDITERRLAEEALKESGERYRSLFTSMDQGFCVMEMLYSEGGQAVDYRFLEVNPAFAAQTGLQDAVGRTAYELIPGLEPVWAETYARVAETGEAMRFEQGSLAMGRVFDVYAFRPGGREGRKVALLFTDITERRRLEAEVRAQFEELDNLYTTAPIGLALVDREFRFVRINRRLAEINGVSAVAHIGRSIREIVPDIADQAEGVFRRVFETGEAILDIELVGETPAQPGVRRVWNENWYPLRDGSGQTAAVSVVVEEITERKRAEEALRASEAKYRELSESQKRFVNDAAHELRAPLTAIQGNLELLTRFRMKKADREAALSEVAKEAARLSRLVNDMLALARGDGGAGLRLEPVRLDQLLRRAFADAGVLGDDHRLSLGRLEALQVRGEPDRLRQLAIILLENAIKYTPPGGEVRLELLAQGGWAEIRVSDTGIGIAAADLARVFERFYRADQSRARDPGGTGLGLSIARWVVEAHGGEIWLESEPGRGTTAVVRLPLGEA